MTEAQYIALNSVVSSKNNDAVGKHKANRLILVKPRSFASKPSHKKAPKAKPAKTVSHKSEMINIKTPTNGGLRKKVSMNKVEAYITDYSESDTAEKISKIDKQMKKSVELDVIQEAVVDQI